MSLVEILRDNGYILKSEGSDNYRLIGHSGLIVKHDCWYSHSLGLGGTKKDLLNMLGLHRFIGESSSKDPSLMTTSKKRASIKEPLRTLSDKGLQYLLSRGIQKQLIISLGHRGLIREDQHGYISFIGCDTNGVVRCISKRAINSWYRLQRWESSGSDKRWSFSFPIHAQGETVILSEGPIDALSIACLEHLKHGKGYEQTCKIATCGAPISHVLSRIRAVKPQKVYLAFDNDDTGRAITARSLEILNALRIPASSVIPGIGKDPNDWLVNRST